MNYKECKEKLREYILARIPFIVIETIEKRRAINMLKEISKETNLEMAVSSMSKGTYNIINNEKLDDSKTAISTLDYFANQINSKDNMTLIFTDIPDIENETVTSRYLYDIVSMAEEKNSGIIVIKDTPVWSNLARMGISIELSLPDEKEILKIITDTLNYYKNRVNIEWTEENYKEAATVLLGLSEIEVKNILSSLVASGTITHDDLVDLKYTKDSMFDDISGLEKIDVDEDLSYGGLENLKYWLDEKEKLMSPTKREQMKKLHIKSPRGILVVGVSRLS